ncbi:MAG: hypothetical protein LBR16_01880 [Treponema sp.]|nr:hypothetical protein [Treponema sp.]
MSKRNGRHGMRPGDIKDESAHFADLDREARDSDIVKRVRLPSPDTPEVYAIALVEHQSTVDFSIVNRVSHYIDRIYMTLLALLLQSSTSTRR